MVVETATHPALAQAKEMLAALQLLADDAVAVAAVALELLVRLQPTTVALAATVLRIATQVHLSLMRAAVAAVATQVEQAQLVALVVAVLVCRVLVLWLPQELQTLVAVVAAAVNQETAATAGLAWL
jgi:hypothetical protein